LEAELKKVEKRNEKAANWGCRDDGYDEMRREKLGVRYFLRKGQKETNGRAAANSDSQ